MYFYQVAPFYHKAKCNILTWAQPVDDLENIKKDRIIMKKTHYTRLAAIMLVCVMAASAFFTACSKQEEEEEIPPPPPSDPLTGALVEDGFDESALTRRTVAFVVENAPDARPQWGMDDENYSPDILLQGEVEGGITRTLWLYSDYKKLPAVIGPMRSARPPYIKFSEMFDSVFIHWGMSHSKGEYIGANSIFSWHGVDHINQMTLDDKEGLYDRDGSRGVSSEHTGIVHTDKLEATMKNEGFRSEPKEFTKLNFFETAQPVSTDPAKTVSVKYSDRADWENTDWTYNEEDEMYHTSSFENDFKRDNLLVLYDDTEYITKSDYQGGGGGSVTYCDYLFSGGKAQLFTKGSVKELQWQRKAGKLMLIDPAVTMEDIEAKAAELMEADKKMSEKKAIREAAAALGAVIAEVPMTDEELEEAMTAFEKSKEAGEVEEDAEFEPEKYVSQSLNKGKTWIGWISANNGGSVKVDAGDLTITMPGSEDAGEGEESADA